MRAGSWWYAIVLATERTKDEWEKSSLFSRNSTFSHGLGRLLTVADRPGPVLRARRPIRRKPDVGFALALKMVLADYLVRAHNNRLRKLKF